MNPDVPRWRNQSGAPFETVKEKIEELVAMDITDQVEGPTQRVSPVVVVPKQNGKIRLCGHAKG